MYISRIKVKYLNVFYMDFNNIHWNVISQDTFDRTNFPNYYRQSNLWLDRSSVRPLEFSVIDVSFIYLLHSRLVFPRTFDRECRRTFVPRPCRQTFECKYAFYLYLYVNAGCSRRTWRAETRREWKRCTWKARKRQWVRDTLQLRLVRLCNYLWRIYAVGPRLFELIGYRRTKRSNFLNNRTTKLVNAVYMKSGTICRERLFFSCSSNLFFKPFATDKLHIFTSSVACFYCY